MEEEKIGRLVLKQLSVWFGLPVLVAVIVATVVIACFIRTVSAEISAYIGFGALLFQMGDDRRDISAIADLLFSSVHGYSLSGLFSMP